MIYSSPDFHRARARIRPSRIAPWPALPGLCKGFRVCPVAGSVGEWDLRSGDAAGSETHAERWVETFGQALRRGRRPAPSAGVRPSVRRCGGVGDPRRALAVGE